MSMGRRMKREEKEEEKRVIKDGKRENWRGTERREEEEVMFW